MLESIKGAKSKTHKNIVENDNSPRFVVQNTEPREYTAHQSLHSSGVPSRLSTGNSYSYTNQSIREHRDSASSLAEQEQVRTDYSVTKEAVHQPEKNTQYSNNEQIQKVEFEIEKVEDDEPSECEDQAMHQNEQFLTQLQSLISSDQQFGTKLLQLLINKEIPSGLETLVTNRDVSTGNKESLQATQKLNANSNLLAGLLSSASSKSPSPSEDLSVRKKTKRKKLSKRTDLLREMLQEKAGTNKQKSYKPSSFEQNLTMKKCILPNSSSTITHKDIHSAQTASFHFPLLTKTKEPPSSQSFFGLKTLKENVSASIVPQRLPSAGPKTLEYSNNNNTLRNNKSSGSSLKKVSSLTSPISPLRPTQSHHTHPQNLLENRGPQTVRETYIDNTPTSASFAYRDAHIGSERLDKTQLKDVLPDIAATETSEKEYKERESEALKLKRKRNMEASARFRLRKKLRYKENVSKYENLVSDVEVLKNKINDLTNENEFWRKKLKGYYDLKNKELLENIKSSI
ncbi:hypothetical protein ACO0QE_000194 [Hanseniaspora vineae]